jgi:methylmalonyl-CoA mutase C-terminal domain/subunit
MENKIRILMAKPGLDGHDRGVLVVAHALRESGMEVIYTGLRQVPEQIVNAAIQEDVDAIGMSIHSGAHEVLFGEVLRLLREKNANDIVVFGGGIIPKEDAALLKKQGVKEIFGPGTPTDEIVRAMTDAIRQRKG